MANPTFTKRFPANPTKFDPLQGFRFRVMVDGIYVAGASKVGGLKKTTEMVMWQEGGDASVGHPIPGKTKYDAITLEAGVTLDKTFEEWANKVNNFQGDPETSLKNFRKNITIEVLDAQGKVAIAYEVFDCWVSEYQALPQLDASGNAVMITSIKLEHRGFQRKDILEQADT
jgi:phage tail-like protein